MINEVRPWTALRAFASIWVVLFHFKNHFEINLSGSWIENGFLGVDVFFTLSGAVLYYVYCNSLESNEFSYRSFLIKRFARLYPVHLFTLILAISIIFGGYMSGVGERPEYDVIWATLVNLLLLQGWGLTDSLTLNYPSWSISAEFSAYLLFPMLAWITLRFPPRLSLCLAAVVFFLYAAAFGHFFEGDSGGIFRRTHNFSILRIIPEFFFGLTISRFVMAGGLSVLQPMQVWALFILTLTLMVVSTIYSLFIIFVLASGIFIATLMVVPLPVPKVFHYLGIISYSIYMVHGLVEKVGFKIIELAWGFPDDSVPLWTLGPMLILVMISGSIVYHLVEVPGRIFCLKILEGNRLRRNFQRDTS